MLLLPAASLQPLPCAGVGASCPVIPHSISHLSNSHPVVGVISGDYTFADNRAAECLHRRVQKCGGHEGTGAEYCTKPRAAPEIRTVLSASSAPIRDPKAKWVCAWMPSIPVCSVRPAPQFIIRRCRCEGATPSSPLAVCMHKPAAEPINQSSIHLPVGRPRSSSFLSPRPTVNVVIMFWRPRNHYFPFRLAATVARPAGRPARTRREAGAPAFPGFLWPPGGGGRPRPS